jgi:hypothetical protein
MYDKWLGGEQIQQEIKINLHIELLNELLT